MHSTNYTNTFISIAEDCAASGGQVPPERGGQPTVAGLQHAMITAKPYVYTSDDVVFATSALGRALGNDATKAERDKARAQFFSKGQPCLRASALGKSYGWGVHSDANARVAIYGAESAEYREHSSDKALTQLKAMRSKRA